MLLCGIVCISCAMAQKIDSLQSISAQKNLPDTTRVLVMAELAIEYRNIKPDTCLFLAQKALQNSQKIKYSKGQGRAYQVIGIYYYIKGNYEKALQNYQTALPLLQKGKGKREIAWAYTNIGSVYKNQGNYERALENYYKSLQGFEQIKDMAGVGWALGNLGLIYGNQGNYEKSLEYHHKSLEVRQKIGFQPDIATAYTNIGTIYYQKKDYSQSLENHLKSQKIYETMGDKVNLAFACNYIGSIYTQTKDDKALLYLERGLKLAQEVKSKSILANVQASLAQYYNAKNEPAKAQEYAHRALETSQDIGQIESIRNAAEQWSLASSQLGDYRKAYEGLALFKKMNDSLNNEENRKKALQRDFQYKEDKQKLEQEKKDFAYKAQLRQERILLYASLAGFVLMLGVAFFALKAYKTKQKANQLLAEQQQEILTQNEELHQSREEILAQRDFIEVKNKELEEYNRQIKSSINAAMTIQEAILPFKGKLDTLLKEYFVFYKPKDIVSGDFYWLQAIEDKIMVAIVDCTGHGVPGAFMTLIGSVLLDKIVCSAHITSPAVILEKLHQEVVGVLKQKYTTNNSGMDLAIISLEKEGTEQTKIVFSGAKNNLMLLTANKIEEIKGVRRSIGGEQNLEISFVNETRTVHNGSIIYVGTDGLQDQNDKKRKPIGTYRLKEILRQICDLPLAQQKEELERILQKQLEGTTQRDDILFMGFRV